VTGRAVAVGTVVRLAAGAARPAGLPAVAQAPRRARGRGCFLIHRHGATSLLRRITYVSSTSGSP
jgi:hypothetical protein